MQGFRCYTDASTTPDLLPNVMRDAGLDIFIINTDVQPPLSMFVKAVMQGSSSVLMAESALALAATLLNVMGFIPTNLFSDNQLLVNCINGSDPPNSLDWRAAPYT
jgi:hypothetical protein